jgi:hypothetical protein
MFRVGMNVWLFSFREQQKSRLFGNMKLRIGLSGSNEAAESGIMRSHII